MPVAVTAAACGHQAAALADEDHGLLGREDAGADGGGDLADRVTGARPDACEGAAGLGEQAQQR